MLRATRFTRVAALTLLIGAQAGCVTIEKTATDLKTDKGARRETLHADLSYPDEYRLLRDQATKCFSQPDLLMGLSGHEEVRGETYPDQYAEITVHFLNPAWDRVDAVATVKPEGSGSSVEVVVRFDDLKSWSDLVAGRPCGGAHA